MLSNYQLNNAEFCSIFPIGNVKKLVPNFFEKRMHVSLSNITDSLKARIKAKKLHPVLELNQSQWLKPHVKFNTKTE